MQSINESEIDSVMLHKLAIDETQISIHLIQSRFICLYSFKVKRQRDEER